MPYRQTSDVVSPKPQIHVLDWQSDKVVATFVNKTGSNVFFDDIHEIDATDSLETFEFSTLTDFAQSDYLRDMNRILIPGEDNDFHEFIIDEAEQDSYGNIRVRCVASYMELRKQAVIPPMSEPGTTLSAILTTILDQTEWSLNEVEYTGVEPFRLKEYTDAFGAIKAVMEAFDVRAEFKVEVTGSRVTRRYVNFRKSLDTFTGKEVVLGKDLERMTRKESTADVVTALRVVGPENDKDDFRMNVLVEDSDALQRWGRNGRHLIGVFEPDIPDDVEVTEAKLRELGEIQLQNLISSAVEYEADVISIEYLLGRSHEKVRINDVVRVKDEGFSPPLMLSARVIKIQRMVSDPTRKKYEIGQYIGYEERSISRYISRLYDKVESKPTGDYVDQTAKDTLTEAEKKIADAEAELENKLGEANTRLDTLDSELDSAQVQLSDAETDIQNAQDIIDGVTEIRGDVHVLSGTLVTNEIIAENAVLTGTLTASGATILNLTTGNMTANDAYIDNATFNSGVSDEMTINNAYIDNASIVNATITGELVGATGTFTGTLTGGSIDIDTSATIGKNLYLGSSYFGGDHTLYFGGPTGPRIIRRADSLRMVTTTSYAQIYGGTAIQLDTNSTGIILVNGTNINSADLITSGTFSSYRIPNLDASKITSGTFSTDRIPTNMSSYIKSFYNSNIEMYISSDNRLVVRQDGSTMGSVYL